MTDIEIPTPLTHGIGVDQSDFTPADPDTQTADTPEQAPAATEELEILREKGRVLDTIEADPKLTALIQDYVRNSKYGIAPTAIQTPATPATPGATPNTELAALRAETDSLKQMLRQVRAEQVVSEFARDNPDFVAMKSDVGNLLRQHPTMSLPEAYAYVKSTKAAPTSKGRPSAIPEGAPVTRKSTGRPSIADAIQEMHNPKSAPKTFDEAFDLAIKHAKAISED